MEWLVIWGVKQFAGFAFRPILESIGQELGTLTKGAGEDYVKDFFKDSFKSGLNRFKKDALATAMGKAIAQFLYLIQQELEATGIKKKEIEQYNQTLEKFVKDKTVKAWLGKAFEPGCQGLDPTILQDVWKNLNLTSLPDDFNWGRISRVYLIRVEDMIGESSELKDLFSAKQLKAIADNTQNIAGIIPDFDLDRYRESIIETYGHLKLSVIDPTDRQYRVSLGKVFIPQYVREALPPSRYELPKDILEQLQQQETLEANFAAQDFETYQQLFLHKQPDLVLDIVKDPDYLYTVIIGDPGAGKSSFLQYLALEWAENPTPQLPLLIELRDYTKDENIPKDFLEFFHQGKRKICELNQLQLDEQLRSGNALVMFDGLDEIFDNDIKNRIITEIHAFTNKYPQVRVIVTSRIIGYNPDRLTSAQFRHFTLEQLNDKQIEDFSKKWHQLALIDESEQERAEIEKRLQTAIKESPAIRQLAGNPLLLTMMAILNRRMELPRRRIDLYEETTKVLLHQWDIEYKKMQLTLDDVDLRAKQAILRTIADKMQASREGLKGNIIHRDDLEQVIAVYLRSREILNPLTKASKIIDQLRERNFILCHLGNEYYAFVHRTFLEYFCAMSFVERFNKRGLGEGLTIEQLQNEVFGQHWADKSWHEVLRLITSKIDPEFVGDIIEFLIEVYREQNQAISALVLAAECLAEVDSKGKIIEASELLLEALKTALYNTDDQITIAKTITLYWGDKPDVMMWLEDIALNHQEDLVRIRVAQGIAAVKLPHLNNLDITDLGDIYYYQHQYEKAINVYLRGIELSVVSNNLLGVSYVKLKRFDEAIAHYQQWIDREPNNSSAYHTLGYVCAKSGGYQDAVEAFNFAIKITSKNQTAILRTLGKTYHDWGHYQEAISTYQKAIKINSQSRLHSSIYNFLGWVYQDLGQYDDAIACFNQAIKINSKNPWPHNNLGHLYRHLQQWEDAVNAFNTAIEIHPSNSFAYRHLGLTYLLRGDFTQAKQAIFTSIKNNPYNGNGVLVMGILQALQGDLKQARTTWQEGLKLYGEYAQDKRLFRTVYTIAIGDRETGLTTLKNILNQEKPPVGLLSHVLEIAQLLQRCPQPIAGINDAVKLIKGGMV